MVPVPFSVPSGGVTQADGVWVGILGEVETRVPVPVAAGRVVHPVAATAPDAGNLVDRVVVSPRYHLVTLRHLLWYLSGELWSCQSQPGGRQICSPPRERGVWVHPATASPGGAGDTPAPAHRPRQTACRPVRGSGRWDGTSHPSPRDGLQVLRPYGAGTPAALAMGLVSAGLTPLRGWHARSGRLPSIHKGKQVAGEGQAP